MDEDNSAADARTLTAEIVASYVAHNSVRSENLAEIITSVYGALTNLGQSSGEPEPEQLVKPVSVKKSIQNDYLISMEDGKQYKSLKRHLAGRGLSPADYRAKWDLPSTYPMVAPGYSERRSALARSFGLGQKRSDAAAATRAAAAAAQEPSPEPGPEPEMEAAAAKSKRGRKKAEAADAAE